MFPEQGFGEALFGDDNRIGIRGAKLRQPYRNLPISNNGLVRDLQKGAGRQRRPLLAVGLIEHIRYLVPLHGDGFSLGKETRGGHIGYVHLDCVGSCCLFDPVATTEDHVELLGRRVVACDPSNAAGGIGYAYELARNVSIELIGPPSSTLALSVGQQTVKRVVGELVRSVGIVPRSMGGTFDLGSFQIVHRPDRNTGVGLDRGPNVFIRTKSVDTNAVGR